MFLQLVAPQKTQPLDPEDQILRDEEGNDRPLSDEELEGGMAQFDALFPNDMKLRP